MKLQELDDRYVPGLARLVARSRDRLAALAARRPARPELTGNPISQLDQRYGGVGPLGLVREVPQIGFVVIAALLFAGVATARTQESNNRRAAERAAQTETTYQGGSATDPAAVAVDDVLGPDVGAQTSVYEATAASELAKVAASDPDGRRAALVSLTAYQTPGQLVRLLPSVDVTRVYLRARAAGVNATQATVDVTGDLRGDLAAAYQRTALQRAQAAKEFQGYVSSIKVTTAEEKTFQEYYAAYARTNLTEARQYAQACACVFAVIVTANGEELQGLTKSPLVRAVEVAAPGADVATLSVHPLLPEVKGVVPKEQAGPEGP